MNFEVGRDGYRLGTDTATKRDIHWESRGVSCTVDREGTTLGQFLNGQSSGKEILMMFPVCKRDFAASLC